MYCQREGGQTIWEALAVTKPRDIGPNLFESIEWAELSPSTQQCPGGILIISCLYPNVSITSPNIKKIINMFY